MTSTLEYYCDNKRRVFVVVVQSLAPRPVYCPLQLLLPCAREVPATSLLQAKCLCLLRSALLPETHWTASEGATNEDWRRRRRRVQRGEKRVRSKSRTLLAQLSLNWSFSSFPFSKEAPFPVSWVSPYYPWMRFRFFFSFIIFQQTVFCSLSLNCYQSGCFSCWCCCHQKIVHYGFCIRLLSGSKVPVSFFFYSSSPVHFKFSLLKCVRNWVCMCLLNLLPVVS